MNKKVVMITGASSGIGAALAVAFAKKGASLVLFARRQDRLEALAFKIRALGSDCLVITGDVNKQEDLNAAVNGGLNRFSRLDIVIANAGFGVIGEFETLSEADYQRQFETNVFGVIKTARATLGALKKSRGHFTIMGSVMSYFSNPGGSAYAMSKYAVRAFAESLRNEMKKYGVRVTLLCPGLIESELRRVDNEGKFHDMKIKNTGDATWLHMKADVAAGKMIRAITLGRREAVITGHGKILVFLAKHFSGLLYFLLGSGVIRGREKVELPF